MTPALTYLRANWRPLAVLVALVLAYLGGRHGQPARVVHRVDVRWKDRIEWRDREVVGRVEGPIRRTRETLEYPPVPAGSPCADRPTRVVREIEDRGPVVTVARRDADGLVISEGKAAAEKLVERGGTWRAGLMAGVELSTAPRLLLGAHVEARVAGPVWVGAWGATSLQDPGRTWVLGVTASWAP